MAAALHGYTETVRLLLDAGADLEARNVYGFTPLLYAAGNGHTEAVRLLLDAGAAVDARDEGGRTPLRLSAYWGHTETTHLLLDAGATLAPADRAFLQEKIDGGDDEAHRGLAAVDAWQAEQGTKARGEQV